MVKIQNYHMTLYLSFFIPRIFSLFIFAIEKKKTLFVPANLIIINGNSEKSLMSLKADEIVKALLHSSN
jgi:hypothetical protein